MRFAIVCTGAVFGLWVLAVAASHGHANSPPAEAELKVVYFNTDFEDGTLAPFRAAHCNEGCARPAITTEYAHSGRRAVKLQTTSARGWAARLEFRWCHPSATYDSADMPCNPAVSDPTGLYQRFWIMIPKQTLRAVARGEQLKLLLNRYDLEGGRGGGWWQVGIGPEMGSSPRNELRAFEDAASDPGTNISTGLLLKGNVWYKIETWYRRDTIKSKGRAVLWVNNKKVVDSGWLKGMGRSDPRSQQSIQVGIVVAELSEPIVLYVDDIAAANYRVD